MTDHVIAFVSGALVTALLWSMVRDVYAAPFLSRSNVRGIDVPTAGGIVPILSILVVGVVARSLYQVGEWAWAAQLTNASTILFVALLFGFLGLIDDLLATGSERGFAGHIGALVRGRLTTGGLKLVGGGLAAMYLAFDVDDIVASSVDVLVIALAANTANLLDRAPARVTKTAMILLAVVLGVNELSEQLTPLTLMIGATFGLLVVELDEQVMLGDTGVNPVGAVFGFSVVAMAGTWVTVGVLVALVALNLLSERVSFSTVIARNPVLRWYDELGRRVD